MSLDLLCKKISTRSDNGLYTDLHLKVENLGELSQNGHEDVERRGRPPTATAAVTHDYAALPDVSTPTI